MNDSRVRHALIPLDFSDLAAQSLHYGRLLHERLGTRLTVLYADDVLASATLADHPIGYYFEYTSPRVEEMKERVRSHALAQGLEGIPFDVVFSPDAPAPAIVTTAARDAVDLAIMSTHGRTGWRRAVLGSVTESVLRHAPCPVLTIAPHGTAITTVTPFRSIVCPVDSTNAARAALELACDYAVAFSAEVYLINTTSGTDAPLGEATLRSWIPIEMRSLVRYRAPLVACNTAERIVSSASFLGADLIVASRAVPS
jgi:nucleotide-binding universal stress UspA family protein